jgi:hypothetical protein
VPSHKMSTGEAKEHSATLTLNILWTLVRSASVVAVANCDKCDCFDCCSCNRWFIDYVQAVATASFWLKFWLPIPR